MKVSNMPAGPQVNALVAEHVMAWQGGECDGEIGEYSTTDPYCQQCGEFESLSWGRLAHQKRMPGWSESIAAAWQIVDKYSAAWNIDRYTTFDSTGNWRFQWSVSFAVFDEHVRIGGMGQADTAPLAICRAALLAVGVTDV